MIMTCQRSTHEATAMVMQRDSTEEMTIPLIRGDIHELIGTNSTHYGDQHFEW